MRPVTSPDSTPIAVECAGSGPPLVLVHGSTATGKRWAPVLPALAGKFTVHCMDRRGRGGSGDSGAYAIEREIDDVAAVVAAAGSEVDLLGHSFGAICALEAALRTRNVRRLVLYEPPIPTPGLQPFPPGSIVRMQALLERGDREGMLAVFFLEVNGMPAPEFERFRASPAWPARVALAHTLPREMAAVEAYRFDAHRFQALGIPALLLLGAESPPFFGAAVRAVCEALPDARIHLLAGQRHVAMDTAPGLFVEEVLGFLR